MIIIVNVMRGDYLVAYLSFLPITGWHYQVVVYHIKCIKCIKCKGQLADYIWDTDSHIMARLDILPEHKIQSCANSSPMSHHINNNPPHTLIIESNFKLLANHIDWYPGGHQHQMLQAPNQ